MRPLELDEVGSVGHAELRARLREVLDSLPQDRPIAVTNRNRVEAYLVSPAELDRLATAEEQLDRLRSSLPVMVAAIQARVAYPADALRGLIGIDLSVDWERMNAFQAAMPTEVTHDEGGRPLPGRVRALRHEPTSELDDELTYG